MCITALLAALLLPQAPVSIAAGPLQVTVHISRTAQLFHVVDQLSQWSPFCHRQYGRWLSTRGPLTEDMQAALEQHRQLRSKHGWGQGLEQALYTDLDLDRALQVAVETRLLTEAEAAAERSALLALAPRLEPLFAEAPQQRLRALADSLRQEQERLAVFAAKLARFTVTERVEVPVFLVANPAEHDCGGGFNGGRLVLEPPLLDDVRPILQHELLHAFLEPHQDFLKGMCRGVPGLDPETLNEGICYALAPGLLHDDKVADPLLAAVAEDLRRGVAMTDPLARFRRFGLAVRPLLRPLLDEQVGTLVQFAPKAVDAWRVLSELERARTARPK